MNHSRPERSFLEEGYSVARGVFSPRECEALRILTNQQLLLVDDAHKSRFAHHGSMVPLTHEEATLRRLVMSQKLRAVFQTLGFLDPRWISAYIIAKPPRSPGLWWHQDWWAWGHPISVEAKPAQIFCLTYLSPTSPENGCLRVLPGSHLKWHRLHEVLPEAHSEIIEREAADSPAHASVPGEQNVILEPGDVVIGDVRLLHATHANATDIARVGIDLVFTPNFSALPPEFRSHYVQHPCQPDAAWWVGPEREAYGDFIHMLPTYAGPPVAEIAFARKPVRMGRLTA